IVIFRQEAGPFSGKQIELVKNFAAQAVIAIENTRLLNELRESLERQTATSEVLRVISRSPGEVAPVFQAMLDNATRICEANFGGLYVRDGDEFRLAAIHNMPPALADARRRVRPEMQTPMGRAIRNRQVVHVAGLAADQSYLGSEPPAIAAIELGGVRTLLVVPMLREQELIGTINIFRQEVRPFNEKQIELSDEFRGASSNCDREHAPTQRAARIAAAADRHRRRAQGDQPLDFRSAGSARHAGRIGCAPVRSRNGTYHPSQGWGLLLNRHLWPPPGAERLFQTRSAPAFARKHRRTSDPGTHDHSSARCVG